MSIRTKIIIGYLLLSIIVITTSAFWAAQTLGLRLESTDVEKFSNIEKRILKNIDHQYQILSSKAKLLAESFKNINIKTTPYIKLKELSEKIKVHLKIDWFEILLDSNPILYPEIQIDYKHIKFTTIPTQLSKVGPFSEGGYITFTQPLTHQNTYYNLFLATKLLSIPNLHYIIWNNNGVLLKSEEIQDIPNLDYFAKPNNIFQIYNKGKLLKITTKVLTSNNFNALLMYGFEVDMPFLTKSNINDLMFKIAIIEVIGLIITGYFLGIKLLHPLKILQKGIEQVASGKWQELPISNNAKASDNDEINMLAISFNNMVKELKNTQNRLIEVQRQLMQKEKMAILGRFAANVAHEINNPLASILISAGIIKESLSRNINPNVDDVVTIIEETKRCKNIIEALLKYAQNKPPNIKPISLHTLITSVQQTIDSSQSLRNIPLTIKPVPDITVYADVTGITQTFRNLLQNAKEAVEKVPNPMIIIQFKDNSNDDFITIEVLDNGPGIPQEISENIFEPLVTTKETGTGLGLAICQTIIEAHGCKIWANRSEDGWTIFAFTLKKAFLTNNVT